MAGAPTAGRRGALGLAVAAVLAWACRADDRGEGTSARPPTGADHRRDASDPLDASRVERGAPRRFVPPAFRRLPRAPGRLATLLLRTSRATAASTRRWLRKAGPRSRPPRALVLQALLGQRIVRVLASDERLGRAVVARLPIPLAPRVEANASAHRELSVLATPVADVDAFATGRPAPPRILMRHYRAAERRFDVDWAVLAAVNLVESNFGRARATSHAGARGPMQFLPSTWAAYGMGGDVHDPRDAIFGAANYLSASGAPSNYRAALYAYNPSRHYVRAVELYARQMMRRPLEFYVYYSWQLFVKTTRGAMRLTGPGLRR